MLTMTLPVTKSKKSGVWRLEEAGIHTVLCVADLVTCWRVFPQKCDAFVMTEPANARQVQLAYSEVLGQQPMRWVILRGRQCSPAIPRLSMVKEIDRARQTRCRQQDADWCGRQHARDGPRLGVRQQLQTLRPSSQRYLDVASKHRVT